jgi:hypothetical protein
MYEIITDPEWEGPMNENDGYDMGPVMEIVADAGYSVLLQHAGGNGYCYYVGEGAEVDGALRYPVVVGPVDESGVGSIGDVMIGPDDDGETEPYVLADRLTVGELAELIVEAASADVD